MTDKAIIKKIDLSKINEHDLITRDEASKILNIQVCTLGVWGSKKIHLPYIKIGRYVRYLRQDVEAFKQKIKMDSSNRKYITRFTKKNEAEYINPAN
jgi:hypothetical protein